MTLKDKLLKTFRYFFSGYFTFSDIINLLQNQIIFQVVKFYYGIKSRVTNQPGVVSFKSGQIKDFSAKYALVSFLRYPLYKLGFRGKIRYYFSTNGLVIELVKALNKLGYECDVIDMDNRSFIPKKIMRLRFFTGLIILGVSARAYLKIVFV